MSDINVSDRATFADPQARDNCIVCGCRRPTQRSEGRGLSHNLCKPHAARQRKTGSAYYGNLDAVELRATRSAARRLYRQHHTERDWHAAVFGLDLLLRSTDGVRWHGGLKGLPSSDKARVILARARTVGMVGETLLEVALAVAAMVRQLERGTPDYLFCQLSKPLVRLHVPTAWRPRETSSRSSGRMLRALGKIIWSLASIIATAAVLDEVIRLAAPKVASARQAEARRKANAEVRRATEAKLKRVILQASERGAGPTELADIETRLRQQYGLRLRHGR